MEMNEATQFVSEMIGKILGDPEEGLAYSEGPSDYITASGVTEMDLSDVDYDQAFETACEGVPNGPAVYARASASASASASAGASASASASASAVATLEHSTNHIVYNYYEGDTTIIENLEVNTNISNTEVNNYGDGDVDVNTQQANADGDVTQNNDSIDIDVEIGREEAEGEEDPKHPDYEGPKDDPYDMDQGETEVNTNISDTVINNAGGGNVDVNTQQANADGDVTQNNDSLDIDAQFGGGAKDKGDHGDDDGGYGQGEEVNTNASSTTVNNHGGGDVDVNTQQANADGDVTQNNDSIDIDVEIEAPVFEEPAELAISEPVAAAADPVDDGPDAGLDGLE